jgi:methylenetetrahydrofolate reductase (NADPH)
MSSAPRVSFEFFPPADAAGEERFWATLKRLQPLAPQYVSITCGADGSTRERTPRLVAALQGRGSLQVAPHLTCVGVTRAQLVQAARQYRDAGIRHLVALRGDPPRDQPHQVTSPNGLAYAVDLVRALKSVGDFQISVAAYPETHPQAPSAQFDLLNLKRKLDAGAARAITQFFFGTDVYLRFRDRCAAAGITAAIVPGILPITQLPQIARLAQRCGASIPAHVQRHFEGLESDPGTRQLISASLAMEQACRLQREGVDEFHFYTLNRAELTYAVCHALGMRAAQGVRAPERPAALPPQLPATCDAAGP